MTIKTFTILIADRNPHVRELLKRELASAGYRIHLAKTAQEVVELAFKAESPDLLIMDPDLPDNGTLAPLRRLKERIPTLPLVLHAHGADSANGLEGVAINDIIEKSGNSIENVKKAVARIFDRRDNRQKTMPRRSAELDQG